jgi:pilus assembly protein CpaE
METLLLIIVLLGLFLILGIAVGAFLLLRGRNTEEEARPQTPAQRQRVQTSQAEAPAEKEPESAPTTPAKTTAPISGPAPRPKPQDGRAGQAGDLDDKIRILVVDDNPDTRGHVSRLLYFEDDMDVIGQAINGRDGIEQAIEHKPHIVLMDINMPDMDGITATKEMSLKAPYSQVIIMSVQAEQHYMKQAMAAGARDFQPKPFTADELINCIHRVYDIGRPIYAQLEAVEEAQTQAAAHTPVETRSAGGEGAPVIAVYSPKGGIGTSALAANLAVALQREYGDVVLMDADFQFGDILVHLNTRATRTISDLIHDSELDIELLLDVVLAHNSGLKLLLAPPQPELADAITAPMVTEVIEGLRKHFNLVVVDTNCKLDDRMMAILDRASHVLMVTSPELPAVKSAKLFLELADLLDYGSKKLSVVVNRANLPGGYSIRQVEKVLKLERTYAVPYDPRMHLAINKGTAVTQQDVSAPSAQAIIRLAAEVWQKVGQPETRPVQEAAGP